LKETRALPGAHHESIHNRRSANEDRIAPTGMFKLFPRFASITGGLQACRTIVGQIVDNPTVKITREVDSTLYPRADTLSQGYPRDATIVSREDPLIRASESRECCYEVYRSDFAGRHILALPIQSAVVGCQNGSALRYPTVVGIGETKAPEGSSIG
jgi:hypothetical protein